MNETLSCGQYTGKCNKRSDNKKKKEEIAREFVHFD